MSANQIDESTSFFTIDPLTRVIIEESESKTTLVRGDHNSRVIVFEAPLKVEGHDLSIDTEIRINFINVGMQGQKSSGVAIPSHKESDLENDALLFTWSVSRASTMYTGSLTFAIQFLCLDGETVTYEWRTGVYKGIPVLETIDGEEVLDLNDYQDILESWYAELIAGGESGLHKLEDYVENTAKPSVDTYVEETIKPAIEAHTDEFVEALKTRIGEQYNYVLAVDEDSTYDLVYTQRHIGSTDQSGVYKASTNVVENALVVRDTNGEVAVPATPTTDASATSKKYVDTTVSTAESHAKNYADSKASTAETNAKNYADSKASTAETNAKNYADNLVTTTPAPSVKRFTASGILTTATSIPDSGPVIWEDYDWTSEEDFLQYGLYQAVVRYAVSGTSWLGYLTGIVAVNDHNFISESAPTSTNGLMQAALFAPLTQICNASGYGKTGYEFWLQVTPTGFKVYANDRTTGENVSFKTATGGSTTRAQISFRRIVSFADIPATTAE